MKPKSDGTFQQTQKMKHVQQDGPNWILIAGGALISTLSIRLGCFLKHSFETRRLNSSSNLTKENRQISPRRSSSSSTMHSKLYCSPDNGDGSHHCLSVSGRRDGCGDIKQAITSPISKEIDYSLPLVKVSAGELNKDPEGVILASSPDRLELPHRPFYQSNCSDSPCVSECGSDIYSKREVIQKLRQQLKKRDEMIIEMQTQIADLQNSHTIQMNHSALLQSQIDSANCNLLISKRELQQLRKAVADHCLTGVTNSPARRECMNGQVNGYCNGEHYFGADNGRGDTERVEMLKTEVGELKEVIEGKELLIQTYKEQKVELCSKLEELQQRLASQIPSIL